MTKVKFYNDFQGVETNNVFYPAGIHDVPEHVADRVVKDGRAEYAEGNGTASFENSPQFDEVPPYVETTAPEVAPVMTSSKSKKAK